MVFTALDNFPLYTPGVNPNQRNFYGFLEFSAAFLAWWISIDHLPVLAQSSGRICAATDPHDVTRSRKAFSAVFAQRCMALTDFCSRLISAAMQAGQSIGSP